MAGPNGAEMGGHNVVMAVQKTLNAKGGVYMPVVITIVIIMSPVQPVCQQGDSGYCTHYQ